jgi:hypothetical protein
MSLTPSQLTALKSECQNDPTALGLVAPFAAKSWGAVSALLNAVSQSINIDRDFVEPWEIVEAMVSSEWSALAAAEKQRLQTVLSGSQVYVKGANTRAAFLAAFAGGTTTRTNLAALQTRKGSRAEQLFGVPVTDGDIEKAAVA